MDAGAFPSLACPACLAPLELAGLAARCPVCSEAYRREGGIWRLLRGDRIETLERFARDYERIRCAEGWGSADPGYYRALPFQDRTARGQELWRQRACSFRTFIRHVLRPLEERHRRPLRVLDLGAGNAWLSYRLARSGHRVVAVDVITNRLDGLGAHVHYDAEFIPVQADFDHLPLGSAAADLALYNGALHYSADIRMTVAEALRVLAEDGTLVVMDSPVYRDGSSGKRMVAEREHRFLSAYGTASNALASEGFLTERRFDEIASALGIRWRRIRTARDRWLRLREVEARILGRREPAKFPVVAGVRAGSP